MADGRRTDSTSVHESPSRAVTSSGGVRGIGLPFHSVITVFQHLVAPATGRRARRWRCGLVFSTRVLSMKNGQPTVNALDRLAHGRSLRAVRIYQSVGQPHDALRYLGRGRAEHGRLSGVIGGIDALGVVRYEEGDLAA